MRSTTGRFSVQEQGIARYALIGSHVADFGMTLSFESHIQTELRMPRNLVDVRVWLKDTRIQVIN